MGVSKYDYEPKKCDGQPCTGDCDRCAFNALHKMKKALDEIGLKDATGLMDSLFKEGKK